MGTCTGWSNICLQLWVHETHSLFLFINHRVISHTNHSKPTFIPPVYSVHYLHTFACPPIDMSCPWPSSPSVVLAGKELCGPLALTFQLPPCPAPAISVDEGSTRRTTENFLWWMFGALQSQNTLAAWMLSVRWRVCHGFYFPKVLIMTNDTGNIFSMSTSKRGFSPNSIHFGYPFPCFVLFIS